MNAIRAASLVAASLILAGAASPADWRQAAVVDVEAAYRVYRDNHPGYFDPSNPGFRNTLERARAQALKAANETTDLASYSESLGTFSAEFADGHARAFAGVPDDPKFWTWPGFVAAWRGSSLYVFNSMLANIPAGARIESCDAKPIRTIIVDRLRTQGMRIKEAGHWWARSPRAFVQTPLVGTKPPERCTFKMGARTEDLALHWAKAPDDLPQQLKLASDGETSTIGLTEPRSGIFQLGLPTFNPDEKGAGAYRRLYETLAARHSELEAARAVILDLRGNDGGSSDWGLNAAKALWGDQAVEQRQRSFFRNVQIWWRASKENAAYIEAMASDARQNGIKDDVLYYDAISRGMNDALGSGKKYYVDAGAKPAATARIVPPKIHTPVYVFVSGRCTSACLDALDIYKLFPNVRLVGAPTAADSVYIDVRLADLPSGKGKITIPLKIWKDRPRSSGQIYTPDLEVDALDWSNAAFLDAVEQDLNGRSTRR